MPAKKASQATPNELLKRARLAHSLSQKEVAEKIGTNTQNIIRWERGNAIPQPYVQKKLCTLFSKTPEDLGFLKAQTTPHSFNPKTPVFDDAIPDRFADREDFVGRDVLFRGLKQNLSINTNVVLTALNGLPGVGKTALAVELAHDSEIRAHYYNGILWAGLGQYPNILEVLSRWGKCLGISNIEMEKLHDHDAWKRWIRAAISERRMLLVIDDAWKVEDVLVFEVGGPSCAYLVTTRMSTVATYFRGDRWGGQIIHVQELSEGDGVTLMERLAPLAVEREPEEARALVRAVGGLPLALTLMGSYLFEQTYHNQPHRIHTALEKLQHVEERVRLERPLSNPQRHPSLLPKTSISLEAVIEVSDEALDEVSRQALRAFSVFPAKPNTFSDEAALVVAATTIEVLDRLVDAGLVEFSRQNRYTLHQTIADYARINRTDLTASKRMIEYFINYIDKNKADYNILEQEVNNIQTALQSAFEHEWRAFLIKGTNGFFHFLQTRGLYAIAEGYLKQAEQATRDLGDTPNLMITLCNLGRVAQERGNYRQAEEYLQEGLDLARKLEDDENICIMLQYLGSVATVCGDLTKANEYLQEGLSLARQIDKKEIISMLLKSLSSVANRLGDYHQGEKYTQEGLALARQVNNKEIISQLLQNLGVVAAERGDLEQAERDWKEGLALAREIGHRERVCAFLHNLAVLEGNSGNLDQAQKYLQEGLALARQIDHPEKICSMLEGLGGLAGIQGDHKQAESYLQEGLTLARQIGHRERISALLQNLGEAAFHQRNYVKAEVYLQEALSIARDSGTRWLIGGCLNALGEVHLKQQQFNSALKLFREAFKISEQVSQERVADALYGLARVAFEQGDNVEALRKGEASLTIFETIHHSKVATVKAWLVSLPKASKDEYESGRSS